MSDLYVQIESDIETLFNANFTRNDVAVAWRTNDAEPRPNALTTALYVRAEVHFGQERIMAIGGGAGNNQRLQFGSVGFICYASRSVGNESTLLSVMSDLTKALRGKIVSGTYGSSTLSFIGPGSGFDVDSEENGMWFLRGTRLSYEYRFIG